LSCSRAKNLLTATAATFPIRLFGKKKKKKDEKIAHTHWKSLGKVRGTKGFGDQSAGEVLAKVVNCFYCQQHATLVPLLLNLPQYFRHFSGACQQFIGLLSKFTWLRAIVLLKMVAMLAITLHYAFIS